MRLPSISVIVVCKNPGARLREALASVWMQQDITPDIIVIDGGSTDGSREWLEANRTRLTYFISEADSGIYDAMNKGVAAARSDWVLFLGADDRLVGTTILSEMMTWAAKTESAVIVGEAAYDDGRIYKLRSRINPVARNFIHHQASAYRRALFAENGGFDPSLAAMADYDLNIRLWKSRVRFKPIPLRIAACRSGGASDSGSWQVYREEMAVRHRYYGGWRCWLWDVAAIVRFARKQIVVRRRRSATH